MYWFHACHVVACIVLICTCKPAAAFSLFILSPHLSAQYYGIQTMAVAPYGYAENNIASNKADPPLLHVMVEQNDEWGFDASTHDVHLSLGLHTSELYK